MRVKAHLKVLHPDKEFNHFDVEESLAYLYWQNLIFANKDITKFSLMKVNDDYLKLSERMATHFDGFALNDKNIMYPKDEMQSINIDTLIKMLKSSAKDEEAHEPHKWMFKGPSRFLDKQNAVQPHHRVIYASMPRSGNSFLRKYLEQISGVITGSDLTLNFLLNMTLQQIGFKGEQIVDDSVWICKTHYPLIFPADLNQTAGKAVCCIRNPMDVIMSEFNFILTWTHNKAPSEDCHVKYQS